MRRHLAAQLFLLMGISLATCTAGAAAEQLYKVDLKKNVQYGTGGGEKLVLDLATPQEAEGPLPGVVMIHGGGWTGGSKDSYTAIAQEFAKHGYVAVSVGYRFAPKHRFPAQIEDCKCAVRYLRAHAEELKLDKERIGAMGASAGGHLSMMLGVMDPADGLEGEGGWQDQSSKVQAVVAYFGPTNLLSEYPDASRKLVEQFIGGTAQEKEEAFRQASPITYVNSGDAPMLLFQGTKDSLVPYDQAFQMATALSDAGVGGRVEILLGRDHGWQNPEMLRTLLGAALFLNEHLAKK